MILGNGKVAKPSGVWPSSLDCVQWRQGRRACSRYAAGAAVTTTAARRGYGEFSVQEDTTSEAGRLQAFSTLWRASWQACTGLALLYAWLYLLFFSNTAYTGLTLNIPETYWGYAAISEAVTAGVLMAVSKRRPLPLTKPFAFGSALLMAVGSLGSWAACCALGSTSGVVPVMLAVAGVGSTYLWLLWLRKMLMLPAEAGRFAITCSFLLSFVLYLAAMLLPRESVVVIAALLPLVSAGLAFAVKGSKPCKQRVGHVEWLQSPDRTQRMKVWAIAGLLLLLWLNFAFFRIIASPWDTAALETVYPFLFIVLAVLMACTLLLYFRSGLHSVPQLPRAIVCVLCLSYLFLYFDFENPLNGMVSFAICFSCIVIMQLFVWSIGLSLLRQTDLRPTQLFLPYCIAKGIGVFVGVELGVRSCVACGGSIPATFPFLLLTLLFTLTMIVDMSWIRKVLGKGGNAAEPSAAAESDKAASARAAEYTRKALLDAFAQRYGITAREQDVLELLIAGRNRPFIQEELCISRGTVNSHVSSIYGKTEAHSQQDIISLYEQFAQNAR